MPDHSRPSPPPAAPNKSRSSLNELARRLALLDAAILHWLRDAGWSNADAATQGRTLAPLIEQWLIDRPSEQLFEQLPPLIDRLIRQLPSTCAPTTAAFIAAFARSLISHAMDEVAMEAQRAGHAPVFAGLRPYLHVEPTSAKFAELGVGLQLSQPALAIALSRLRHRLRQRIESGLGLWATSAISRQNLRQQLRQSLIGTESTP